MIDINLISFSLEMISISITYFMTNKLIKLFKIFYQILIKSRILVFLNIKLFKNVNKKSTFRKHKKLFT